jgi:thiol-disulfide isomerase/thioredoxin
MSCDTQQNENLPTGTWRAELTSDTGTIIPFNFEIVNSPEKQQTIYLLNGEERILIDDVVYTDKSVTIPMHVFDSQITAQYDTKNKVLKGHWIKHGYGKEYKMPFEAKPNQNHRFEKNDTSTSLTEEITGKWEVTFADDTVNAIGLFEQKGDKVTGTFLTVTGDYRFLEGTVNGNEMNLSCFDGAHAFLFKAKMEEDGSLLGDFWSGKTYHTSWTAKKNQNYELPSPNSLTFLKKGYDKIEFAFPDLNGDTVKWNDNKYKGKVLVLQIFGTWCPNCLDETLFYTSFYNNKTSEDFEILGLAYESTEDFDVAAKRVQKMKKRLGTKYDFLIAGVSKKIDAGKSLPMLNHIMSFPTSIFIDKWGNVRRIHTGFSGPGTGKYYEEFVEDFNLFVNKLINEKSPPKNNDKEDATSETESVRP